MPARRRARCYGAWVLGAWVLGATVLGATVLGVLYQDISHIRKMRSHGGDACVVWPMTRCSEPS